MLQVLLPCKFAVYANALVAQAQAQAGLPQTRLLTPLVSDPDMVGPNAVEGLYFWHIGKNLMWQQLDRRIDEWVFIFLLPVYR